MIAHPSVCGNCGDHRLDHCEALGSGCYGDVPEKCHINGCECTAFKDSSVAPLQLELLDPDLVDENHGS